MGLLWGCSADVEVPEAPTAQKISDVLLKQLEVAETHCKSGNVGVGDLSALDMSVVWLRGHLIKEGTGTEEQIAALDDIHRRIVALGRGSGAIPGENEAGRPPSPASVEGIVNQIRAVLETIPRSEPAK